MVSSNNTPLLYTHFYPSSCYFRERPAAQQIPVFIMHMDGVFCKVAINFVYSLDKRHCSKG